MKKTWRNTKTESDMDTPAKATWVSDSPNMVRMVRRALDRTINQDVAVKQDKGK